MRKRANCNNRFSATQPSVGGSIWFAKFSFLGYKSDNCNGQLSAYRDFSKNISNRIEGQGT